MSLTPIPEISLGSSIASAEYKLSDAALRKWNAALKPKSDSKAHEINILGDIGSDPWSGREITAGTISDALSEIGEGDVVVNINSPGGSYFEGVAIYNLLREHNGKVTARILGIAASAASVITMAADEVQMAKSGNFMIHNAWVLTIGNRHDLVKTAQDMQMFDASMADLYSERSGQDQRQVAKWMDRETFFTGEQSLKYGFADALLSGDVPSKDDKKDVQPANAAIQIDQYLMNAGLSRGQRRKLISSVKEGTPSATRPVMPSADEVAAALSGVFQT